MGMESKQTTFNIYHIKATFFLLICSGIQLEALAFELCGTLIRQIEPNSCVAKDGRLRSGDLIVYLNHECLWRVTSSQAKTILRRAELVSNAIP